MTLTNMFFRLLLTTSIITPLLFGSVSALATELTLCKCSEAGFGVKEARNITKCALFCSAEAGGFTKTEEANYTREDIAIIIGNIINAILAFLGVAFMVLVVYAGGSWMFAGGEPEKVQTAKNILQSALLGILIVVSAYVIMNFVFRDLLSAAF